ncbi:hypothetical protein [Jeotgalibacillus aurantiacus]|uniref:hypothetical protein n=1 Tax=Jeotgalibacillus aurantiacus TaxID=2763266 RepID=UPI001D09BD15|nr:hypothetical protein [Jeotgalibacillus aurantiacus]
MKSKLLLGFGSLILSILFVIWTGMTGQMIETEEELATAFPMKTGLPFHFGELRNPVIDLPLPHRYGGDCCSIFITSWSNFVGSILVTFIVLIVLIVVLKRLLKAR